MAVPVMVRAMTGASGSWSRRAGDGAGSGWSVGGLWVGLAGGGFVVMVTAAGRLGCPGDRVGSGQAELGGPALDVRPEPVPIVQIGSGGDVGQDHRGDGGVAVKDLAGQPGHLP